MPHHHRCWRANASAMPALGSRNLSRSSSCLALHTRCQHVSVMFSLGADSPLGDPCARRCGPIVLVAVGLGMLNGWAWRMQDLPQSAFKADERMLRRGASTERSPSPPQPLNGAQSLGPPTAGDTWELLRRTHCIAPGTPHAKSHQQFLHQGRCRASQQQR